MSGKSFFVQGPQSRPLPGAGAGAGGSTWIVLGSSQRCLVDIARVRHAYPDATLITTNRGLDVDCRPQVYFCFDYIARQKFGRRSLELRRVHGTHLVTLNKSRQLLAEDGMDAYDEFLELGPPGTEPHQVRRGQTGDVGMSGLYCLQYALNHGAGRILMVGMEGYSVRFVYHNGDQIDSMDRKNGSVIQPTTQALVELYRDVEFVFYGLPRYEIVGPHCQFDFDDMPFATWYSLATWAVGHADQVGTRYTLHRDHHKSPGALRQKGEPVFNSRVSVAAVPAGETTR